MTALSQAANPSRVEPYKKTGDAALTLHVFTPPGHKPDDPKPAIVFFFGGGWVNGSPRQFYPQCAHLASRGMVAISADYRTKSKHATSPVECMLDAKSAMRHIRAHAEKLGIDPNRIAAAGGSAGGQLALMTALNNDLNDPDDDLSVSCRPNALVLFNPALDGGPGTYCNKRFGADWEPLSPMHNICPAPPPAIIMLGTRDKIISVSEAETFTALMKEAGGACTLTLYEDQPHGFFNKLKYEETLEEADRFLTSLGYLPEHP
jgi:acetyl esterase/lipase